MVFVPELKIAWLNGWLPLLVFYAAFVVLLIIFPRDVVKRLYDRCGWSRKLIQFMIIGRIFTFSCLILLIFSPLMINHPMMVVGGVIYLSGFVILFTALFNYRETPIGQPVTKGLYRVSRNPQMLGLSLLFMGVCVATGSWLLMLLLAISTMFYHFRILAEEESCLALYGDSYREYMKRIPRYLLFF
jgi:protein-S-isoprenylcysteine O-methyltransferase Ste14